MSDVFVLPQSTAYSSRVLSSERYAMRDKKRKISLKPTPEVASIATELTALVKRIETTLQNKYDGATRKRITDKIKVSC